MLNTYYYVPTGPAQYSWDQSGPCSFRISEQGLGFLLLPLPIVDMQGAQEMPGQACPDVLSLGEGATRSPQVPGFASIC